MPRPSRRNSNRRRALELLAADRDGCTERLLLAHGVSIPVMVNLVRSGLATASVERLIAGQPSGRDCADADHRGGAKGAGVKRLIKCYRCSRNIAPAMIASITTTITPMCSGLLNMCRTSPNFVPSGNKFIPHFGHLPGPFCRTLECIGQV
jgi:hypothetical protein